MVEGLIDYARDHVELIQLSVVSGNERARRLYASLGFVEYGVEKKSLKHDGDYYDEILMALDLMSDPDQPAIRVQGSDVALCEELVSSIAE